VSGLAEFDESFRQFLAEAAGNGNIADGRVEPYIENFLFITGLWYRYAPFKVAGNGAFFKAVADPCLGYLNGVIRPEPVLAGNMYPFFKLVF